MAATLTYTTTLARLTCGHCHIPFAIPQNLYNARQADGGLFYCPNGHNIGWSDNENERLKREKRLLEQRLDWAETAKLAARDQARTADYQRRAAKGQLTKIRRRIANGVCPCCNRSFTPLAEHMRTQHPNFVPPPEVES